MLSSARLFQEGFLQEVGPVLELEGRVNKLSREANRLTSDGRGDLRRWGGP